MQCTYVKRWTTLFPGDSAGEGGRNAVSQAGSSFAEGRAEDRSNGAFLFISREMYCENNRTLDFSQELLIFHKNCTRLSSRNNRWLLNFVDACWLIQSNYAILIIKQSGNFKSLIKSVDLNPLCLWQDKIDAQNKLKALYTKSQDDPCRETGNLRDSFKFSTWSPSRGASGQTTGEPPVWNTAALDQKIELSLTLLCFLRRHWGKDKQSEKIFLPTSVQRSEIEGKVRNKRCPWLTSLHYFKLLKYSAHCFRLICVVLTQCMPKFLHLVVFCVFLESERRSLCPRKNEAVWLILMEQRQNPLFHLGKKHLYILIITKYVSFCVYIWICFSSNSLWPLDGANTRFPPWKVLLTHCTTRCSIISKILPLEMDINFKTNFISINVFFVIINIVRGSVNTLDVREEFSQPRTERNCTLEVNHI